MPVLQDVLLASTLQQAAHLDQIFVPAGCLAASDTRDRGDWNDESLNALLLAQLSIIVSPDQGIGNHHEIPARELLQVGPQSYPVSTTGLTVRIWPSTSASLACTSLLLNKSGHFLADACSPGVFRNCICLEGDVSWSLVASYCPPSMRTCYSRQQNCTQLRQSRMPTDLCSLPEPVAPLWACAAWLCALYWSQRCSHCEKSNANYQLPCHAGLCI